MNYYKPILLPSNGIPYDPIVYLKEPDVSLLLTLKTGFLKNSENDIIFSVIKKFTSIKHPDKYYFKDIQYIWFLMLSYMNSSTIINVPYICMYCNNSVTLKVNTSELPLNYADKDVFKNKILNLSGFSFEFRKRFFKDNIITGLNNIGDDNILNNIANFLKPQCIKIYYDNKEFESDFLKDALLEIGINNSSDLFNELKNEDDWGLLSSFDHKCKKCNNTSKAYVTDPFKSSLYFSNVEEDKKIELLETLITLSSFKMIQLKEFLNLPISLFEPTIKSLNKILKKKYGSKNSVDYFEHFEEELG